MVYRETLTSHSDIRKLKNKNKEIIIVTSSENLFNTTGGDFLVFVCSLPNDAFLVIQNS